MSSSDPWCFRQASSSDPSSTVVHQVSLAVLVQIFLVVADNQNWHNILSV